MPPAPAPGGRMLDNGCGIGQILMALDLAGVRAVGIDIDQQALAFGRRMAPQLGFALANGEHLPFPEHSLDLVVSRVASPYMRIPLAVPEIARVMRPGGCIWFVLHPFSMLSWSHAVGSARRLVFEIYRVCNSASFRWQFCYPLKTSLTAYQEETGMRRCLEKNGFTQIEFTRQRHFVVTAQKSGN